MKPLESTPTRLTISGKIRTIDVEFLEEVAGENWNGDCILYAFNAGPITLLNLFCASF
jgi:raffinose synthase